MIFSKDVLTIDVKKTYQEICDFITKQVFTEFKKEGVVIGISGGIDSAVVSALCVKALGKTKSWDFSCRKRNRLLRA